MGIFSPFRPSYSYSSHSRHRSPWSSAWSSSHRGSSSYYRRRPRDGYINRILHQIKRMLRELYYYARRHPVRFFMMVIMPLVTGGALTGVLREFGIRLPAGSFGSRGDYYDGYSSRGSRGGNGLGDFAGGLGNLGSIMKLAQMFT